MYIGSWRTFSGIKGNDPRRYPFPERPHYLSFATKVPGVHRGSICNIFVYYIIHPLASTIASGLLHVYGMITCALFWDMVHCGGVHECVGWMGWDGKDCDVFGWMTCQLIASASTGASIELDSGPA